ncbi:MULTISPECIES: dihydroxyacetone kinase subunit DhaK [Rhizobium]|uniref:Dihydroxyacetone kinase-like protein n=1 Tax=Rhizobium lentis TaxID=1138194 RepID=A0A7W8UK21_9HYPH|nr:MULTISPECIES: dihydroxyacetone kinase subunit DhaK [Rhizobium]ANK86187.1 dihydroxyacetone kinase dihydroxyacetone-binding subunit K 1 [Rhizobium sp. N731]ANK92101.1 dihydroxyacetone kinase dihydroxyacetone-binding subunit K 1 [Rhizobium sp. N6212]ANK98137.1 dihydroxyacetone kinase dihydroxyacetone-binding subunit K 1 [Rhizobium sp. N621]ANL04217.1 dihydroxyacetone kinase dihydroxyacetone-binding subunit K 1 [Rhizobium esperanzae]ANL10232.1 dihydroxyacetone kinase dihydroxyacetone-binding su
MKKFMNTAETMVAESVEGFVRAHEAFVVFGAERKCIRRRHLTLGKVALISGGGAGHEPMHIGFIGQGMLDAACVGHIFTSPTPSQIIAAIEEADTGAGCLLVVKNYDGDLMNFEMAIEMAGDRHSLDMVVVSDDIETSRTGEGRGRRGVAGTLIVEKLIGAAAERGMSLAELKQLGEGLNRRYRSMGVALNGVTVPQTERKTFALGPGEMEMGVGIHGEPGHVRQPFAAADAIIGHLCETIADDIAAAPGMRALLFVNGLGGTPPAELYLAYNSARRFIEERGIPIERSLVGTYVTSLDMQGLSVTLALLTDEEIALWDAPVATAALRWP